MFVCDCLSLSVYVVQNGDFGVICLEGNDERCSLIFLSQR